MRTLVTGGNGFLGRHLVSALRARGDQVVVLARRAAPDLAAEGVQVCIGDLTDYRSLREACDGAELVLHAASHVGAWGAARDFHAVNVEGTRNVIRACRDAGARKLVYTSTPSVVFGATPIRNGNEDLPYPKQYLSDYQRTKAQAEREVLAAHGEGRLATTALRPHAIWGAGDRHLLPRLIAAAGQGRLKIVGDGSNCLSMTHVRNAARAHLQAAGSDRTGGKAYFVNDPQPVNLWSWVNQIVTALGLPPAERRIPYRTAYALGAVLEVAYRGLGLRGEPMVTRYVASLLATEHTFDIANAVRDFGYAPEVGPVEGTVELIEYFRQQMRLSGQESLRAAYS
jgi:nucleoside-diphosphate-sugar epimerase